MTKPAQTPIRKTNQTTFLCGGKLVEAHRKAQPAFSPCGGNPGQFQPVNIGSYPLLQEKEALQALRAAKKAYGNGNGVWPRMSPTKRAAHLRRFADKMAKQKTRIVELLMWEIGKTLADSTKEFDRTLEYIEETCKALEARDNPSATQHGSFSVVQTRSPLGVTLCMGPFNYPLNETFTTLIPALAAGNTVLFKPPKLGVLLHSPLLKAFRDCFPKGVVNTIYGDGQTVINPLMKSGQIDVLAFIGSSRVGNLLKSQHPEPHRLRCIMGLEAKNPGIITASAKMKPTIKECLTGALSFNGQRCTALKILFVHKSIADKFTKKFAAAVDSLPGGKPWDNGVAITPLPEPNKVETMWELINNALKKGAKIANKVTYPCGTFMRPVVLSGVKPNMRIAHEEQFGPIVPIVTYKDINEVLEYIAASRYGQQASVFSTNPKEIKKCVNSLKNQVCRININSQCQRGPDDLPFTGRKNSAEGTLSVELALDAFSIECVVATPKPTKP